MTETEPDFSKPKDCLFSATAVKRLTSISPPSPRKSYGWPPNARHRSGRPVPPAASPAASPQPHSRSSAPCAAPSRTEYSPSLASLDSPLSEGAEPTAAPAGTIATPSAVRPAPRQPPSERGVARSAGGSTPSAARPAPCAARPRRAAFTLLEVLVVLAVVAILGALLFPGVDRAREAGRAAACASNLRQLAAAALAHAESHGGEFPWGLRMEGGKNVCWDFVTGPDGRAAPGAIWDGMTGLGETGVLQCPSFLGGEANWRGDPWTGYNYNCSYVGKVEGDSGTRAAPARLAQIADPARTALFGDVQYAGGANKFMRAPVRDRAFDGSGTSLREAGTQGFRHRGRTNVAFCDGHVESLDTPYRKGGEGFVSPGCGFLSPDNSLYSLAK